VKDSPTFTLWADGTSVKLVPDTGFGLAGAGAGFGFVGAGWGAVGLVGGLGAGAGLAVAGGGAVTEGGAGGCAGDALPPQPDNSRLPQRAAVIMMDLIISPLILTNFCFLLEFFRFNKRIFSA